ncbi:MAG: lipocalin-like domain-containing protein [bacterium]
MFIGLVLQPTIAFAQAPQLVGTWKLVAADVVSPDGRTAADYGPSPRGLAVFTADGQYVVQIYRAERTRFASNDRSRGTPEEYKDAALSISTHFGRYTVDQAKGTISFAIASASFPNLDGTTQVRAFTLVGDSLAWRVPPRPDGSVPVSRFVRVR